MDAIRAIQTRRSIRSFKPDEIPEETIKEILELGNCAPSAGNLQCRDFIVVRSHEVKHALVEAAMGQTLIEEAPVVIVACANMKRISPYGGRGRELYCIQDADAASYAIILAAHAKGYGSCWVGAFEPEMVTEALHLPNYAVPTAIIPIGIPNEKPKEPPKLPVSEITHKEKW
ncbi:MAG: nitroreductase family protein [Candidatus Thermoplasmatota archaeon]|nr:nitroreductase family protein [Candidatus Thermoplasmatota archaeon]